jgi:hypothetical protein
MLGKSNALKRLDGQSVKNLRQEIGGNPRALELLEQIAYKEFKKRDFTWVQLMAPFGQISAYGGDNRDRRFWCCFLLDN